MLVLEHSTRWFEWGALYLDFASAAGWLLCAVLAAAFVPPRGAAATARRRVAAWTMVAAAFVLLAGAAVAAVFGRHGVWSGVGHVPAAGATAVAVGAMLLLALAPAPAAHPFSRPWRWRTFALLAASVPLLHGYVQPAVQPWSMLVVHGGCGVWLLARRSAPGGFADPQITGDAAARILGGALTTLGLGALAALAVPSTAASSLVAALGAYGTSGALWRLYLQERTLPRVRERRGLFGVRPLWLLPMVQALVLAAGGLAQRGAVHQAERFAARRLVDELLAVIAALGVQLPPAPVGAGGVAAADERRVHASLAALLAASTTYRAVALAPAGPAPAGGVVFAVRPAGAKAIVPEDLRPRPGREQHTARAGQVFVRWMPPTGLTDLIIVVLPLPAGPGAGAPWQLSLAVEAQGLTDVIVSHRLQLLAIVALVAVVAGVAVLATVRLRHGHELRLLTAPASAFADQCVATGGAAPPLPEAGTLTGLRLLLVDDHPLVRDLLRDSLQQLGAHVSACADGATALAAATQSRCDVVLLDLKLPDCSPETMLAGLRPAGSPPHEPWIVGLSAGATELEIQRALDRGMNDFLLKPVSIAGLAETLRLSPAGAKIWVVAAGARAAATTDPRAATPDERAALFAEAAPVIERIAHACHIGDTDRAAAEAHFLANSCVVLGLDTAQQICRTIEDAAEQENLAAARDALAGLRTEIARAYSQSTTAPT